MALINVREVYPGVSLGLWRMDEDMAEILSRYPWMGEYVEELNNYKSDRRKLELLTVRALLHEMLLMDGLSAKRSLRVGKICHNENGKPLLQGYHISISHTKGFVAVMASKVHEVAVDIEYYDDRVKRIAQNFLRKDEDFKGIDSLLVCWCGKETVSKLFSDANLQCCEMRVTPFDVMSDWSCEIENLKSQQKVNVDFELTMEYVLTYAALL